MNKNKTYTKGVNTPRPKKDVNVPEHLKNIVLILKNNSEIRRFTALGMINRLKQAGEIPADAKVYINFYFNKFSVSVNGLKQEFKYNNSLFINCLCSSFVLFANDASKTIKEFCNIESCSVDDNEVTEIAKNVQDNNSNPVEE